ncbi:hypothetical protein ACJZ2D_005286 [Fusarium nematophilum]
MGNRERASHSRLLRMPAEILADIVDLLSEDKPTLVSLALVNSDCRQLARSCQFAEVHFDYSSQARQHFLELGHGSLAESQQPTIAACVRRVTFASQPRHVAECHRDMYESIWGETAQSYTREQRNIFREQGNEYYVQLRKFLLVAISTMRNLEALIWADKFPLDRDFFETVTRSTVQHFLSAPLRSLDLSEKILARLGAHGPYCGPFRDLESFAVLALPTKSGPCKFIADFIMQHKHVQRLCIHESDDVHGRNAHLDRYIIPALTSHDFSTLRSLSLAWVGGSIDDSTRPHGVHVPKAALAAIGALVSLEQLSLCAGISFGWRHQWLVDHDELRGHLGKLKSLRKLALVRDTYPVLLGLDVEYLSSV